MTDQDLLVAAEECQAAIRAWIIEQHGQPDQADSVAWWTRNISFFDRERMEDEGAMGEAVGVACEGISGWTNWCASALHDEWYRQGIYLEPFNGWLLTLYIRKDMP